MGKRWGRIYERALSAAPEMFLGEERPEARRRVLKMRWRLLHFLRRHLDDCAQRLRARPQISPRSRGIPNKEVSEMLLLDSRKKGEFGAVDKAIPSHNLGNNQEILCSVLSSSSGIIASIYGDEAHEVI